MNVKSMLVGFLIAVVASTGTYFLLPPPSGAEAEKQSCMTPINHLFGVREEVRSSMEYKIFARRQREVL